jgi:hypothetical protein
MKETAFSAEDFAKLQQREVFSLQQTVADMAAAGERELASRRSFAELRLNLLTEASVVRRSLLVEDA